jgi:hypothetical protein
MMILKRESSAVSNTVAGTHKRIVDTHIDTGLNTDSSSADQRHRNRGSGGRTLHANWRGTRRQQKSEKVRTKIEPSLVLRYISQRTRQNDSHHEPCNGILFISKQLTSHTTSKDTCSSTKNVKTHDEEV